MLKSVQILIISENTHFRGKDHCTAGLQINRLDLTKIENSRLLVCSEAAESKLVKLENMSQL